MVSRNRDHRHESRLMKDESGWMKRLAAQYLTTSVSVV
jgi:hypothetical protein